MNQYNENQFMKMPENHYAHPAQIPIRAKRFNYLINEYIPGNNDQYIMFHHLGHFLIYDNKTKYCLFDASYILLGNNQNKISNDDDLAAVIPQIIINQDSTQRSDLSKDDFSLLTDIIYEIL